MLYLSLPHNHAISVCMYYHLRSSIPPTIIHHHTFIVLIDNCVDIELWWLRIVLILNCVDIELCWYWILLMENYVSINCGSIWFCVINRCFCCNICGIYICLTNHHVFLFVLFHVCHQPMVFTLNTPTHRQQIVCQLQFTCSSVLMHCYIVAHTSHHIPCLPITHTYHHSPWQLHM